MLNDYMKLVYSKIYESLGDKSTDFIKKKAQSLGKCIFIQELETINSSIKKDGFSLFHSILRTILIFTYRNLNVLSKVKVFLILG